MTAIPETVQRVRRLANQLEDEAMQAAMDASEQGEMLNAQVLAEVANFASACVGAMEVIDL